MSRKKRKPDYQNIARLEKELDLDGDGVFDVLEPPPTPPPAPKPMTAKEATAHLERVAKGQSAVGALAAAQGNPLGVRVVPIQRVVASATATNYTTMQPGFLWPVTDHDDIVMVRQ